MKLTTTTPANYILVELLKSPKLYLERRAYDYSDQYLDVVFGISTSADLDIGAESVGDLKTKVEARFYKENLSAYDNSVLLKPVAEAASVKFNIVTNTYKGHGQGSTNTRLMSCGFQFKEGERTELTGEKLELALLLEALILRVFPNIYSNRLN